MASRFRVVNARPIIIRRRRASPRRRPHHNMQWKVAYADFATAMMAFFMLLWLVSNSGKLSLEALADYFGSADSAREIAPPRPTPVRAPPAPSAVADTDIHSALIEAPDLARNRDHLILDRVRDGLRIQLVDTSDQPMFDPGTDRLRPQAVAMLGDIARRLLRSPNRLAIQGHATGQAAGSDYGDWELSADRANAARRLLAKAGIAPDRFAEVAGRGATDPLYPDAPERAGNRRITIILLSEAAATPADFGRAP